jgi:hypothetical protein
LPSMASSLSAKSLVALHPGYTSNAVA